MANEPVSPTPGSDASEESAHDLFGKLDSLIQKHHGRGHRAAGESVPMLTEPIESQTRRSDDIPVLEDVIDESVAAAQLSGPLAQARRQLQVALYLRLRQRLDQELEGALADSARLGEIAVDPAFTRVAQELRAILPVVVRESVEQVLAPATFESLINLTGRINRS